MQMQVEFAQTQAVFYLHLMVYMKKSGVKKWN